jgi:hypothetical protein
MKKGMIVGTLTAFAFAVPALAAKPTHPTHPVHPTHPAHPSSGTAGGNGGSKSHKSCDPINKGYNASGTFASGSLTAGTTAGRYDGTLTVTVSRVNHKSASGDQTYTLSNARVHFEQGVTSTTLAAGDRVKVSGKITALRHGCDTTGFTPTVTVHSVTIKAPKASHS